MKPKDFVKTYAPYAFQMEAKIGLSAIAILSQAALESGWGRSCPGNMMFGVKAKKGTPRDKRQLLMTTEYLKTPHKKFPVVLSVTPINRNGQTIYKYKVKDWFMKYPTPYESFIDHAILFFKLKRYAKAWEVRYDAVQFFVEIAKAGYATAPNYAERLIKVSRTIKHYLNEI